MSLSDLSLDRIADAVAAQRTPPVERWNPPHCGHSGIRIAADGSWHHEGRPIARPELVRLFATVLRRELDGGYVLVTPAEKLAIDVEDAPLLAIELASDGKEADRRLAFRLNTNALVIAGPANPLRVEMRAEGPRPYLAVRPGIDARIERGPWLELVELALAEGADPPGLWSDGAFFALDAA